MSVSVGSSAIEAGKLVAIVVVPGDPIVWFMRLHTCAAGAACQRAVRPWRDS
jgi:hypothetical protein